MATRLSDNKCLLSILLPAYGYGEGIRRILKRLESIPVADCEIIVFDNSPDTGIEKIVMDWLMATGIPVTYKRNRPTSAAASNWNNLLDAASGEFCLLLHHDEFPLGESFVEDLLHILRQSADTDALLLDCILVNPKNFRNRRHIPTWLRALVVTHFPGYLLRRNIIGPASALVVRRRLYPRFDEKLQWLVDVDVYVRLLKATRRVKICPHIRIGSMLGRSDSLTAVLRASISRLDILEKKYLFALNPDMKFWLGSMENSPVYYGVLRICEAAAWCLFRLVTRFVMPLGSNAVPRAGVRKFF